MARGTLKGAARTLASVAVTLDATGVLLYCARAHSLFGDPALFTGWSAGDARERLDPSRTMLLAVALAVVRLGGLVLYVSCRRAAAAPTGTDEAAAPSETPNRRCRRTKPTDQTVLCQWTD